MAVLAPELPARETRDYEREPIPIEEAEAPERLARSRESPDLFAHVPPQLLPAPFLTGAEVEDVVTLSRYEISQMTQARGWSKWTVLLRLGRGRGSPRLFPLVMLPAFELMKSGRVEPAMALMSRGTDCLGKHWLGFADLLRASVSFYPGLMFAISRSDGVGIARGLGSSPDLLAAARASALEQFDCLRNCDPENVAIARWLKVELKRTPQQVLVFSLPPVIQDERTGPYGPAVSVLKAGGWAL